MASSGQEVELLQGGMKLNSPDRGSFYQNLRFKQGEWSTRPGFGQVAQFDTTLSKQTTDKSTEYGYGDPLGSHVMLTNFGHLQIVTVLPLFAFTGNVEAGAGGKGGSVGQWSNLVAVSIYDYTTDCRWEEVLSRHTSEMNEDLFPMRGWKGVYQSSVYHNREDWIPQGGRPWFFHEFVDSLFFGSPDVGMFVYTPCDFYASRRQQVDGSVDYSGFSSTGYSESACVRLVSPTSGTFDKAYVYLDRAGFPKPSDVTDWGGRMVLASGRDLYFSDSSAPSSVIAINVVTIPGDSEIVAIEGTQEGVVVFFDRETWVYYPSRGALNNTGRRIQISDSVGADSPRAVISADELVFWCDRNGVYSTSGGMDYKVLSDDIEPFFHSYVSNPFSSYWIDSGNYDGSNPTARSFYAFADAGLINLTYDPIDKHLFITCPALGISFVWQQGVWVLWNYQSLANTVASEFNATDNLALSQLVCGGGHVFSVCGRETYSPADQIQLGGTGAAESRNAKMGSYFITELGRGGGLDRSVESFEDNRKMSGSYREFLYTAGGLTGVAGRDRLLLGEPVDPGPSYRFPSGQAVSDCVLVPVRVSFNSTSTFYRVQSFDLVFQFDNQYWRPVTYTDAADGAGQTRVDLVFPPERSISREAWGLKAGTAAVPAQNQASVYDVAGAAYSATGNELRLYWDGSIPAFFPVAANSSAPYMNFTQDQNHLLFYLPFQRLLPTADAMSLGLVVTDARFEQLPAVGPLQTWAFTVYHWMPGSAGSKHAADDVAYPVDWVALPGPVSVPDGSQLLFRSLYMRLKSQGAAATVVHGSSTFGLFNVVVAGDARKWAAQIIDYTGGAIQAIISAASIRTRLQTAALAMVDVVFGSNSKWGTESDSSKGNVLIADDPVNDIAVSDAVRGAEVDVMMFGHIRNRAEKIGLSAAKMMYRIVGGRRRRGR